MELASGWTVSQESIIVGVWYQFVNVALSTLEERSEYLEADGPGFERINSF